MDDELLGAFVSEIREHLVTIEADLLSIEESGEQVDRELVNKVFRAAHSIKGGSSFFGLVKIKDLAHRAENVLDMMRSGKMLPNAEITNVLLAAFNRLREMINQPAESNDANIDDLMASLSGLAASYLPQEQKASLHQAVVLQPEGGGSSTVLPKLDIDQALQAGNRLYRIECDLIHDMERQGRTVLQTFHALWASGEILDCAMDFEAVGSLDGSIGSRLPLHLVYASKLSLEEILALFHYNRDQVRPLSADDAPVVNLAPDAPVPPVSSHEGPPAQTVPVEAMLRIAVPGEDQTVTPLPVPSAPPMHAMPEAKPAASPGSGSSSPTVEDTIRVNVGILERLVNLAGELVLGRNQLRASIAQKNARSLATADQRINQITSELQDVIMQTRLQPIGNVFGKFPRVVRDLSAALHKEIQLEIEGKDVALDKSLIEALSDPLTHMVRNAVDHGIEFPEERQRAGKKRQGNIHIEARHEAGQVLVEIADDGHGIDAERVAQAALAKGLIAAERVQGMSGQDKMALIFLPGLSTSESVSDVSGRGVGMDVVKTNLDRLGGKVEIASEMGKGTTFRIKLPLTLAIIPCLIFSVEGERFAIPQINVEELLRVQPGAIKTRIEVVGDTEVLVLRDRLIPLVRFASLLGVDLTYSDPDTGRCAADRRTNLADRRSPRHPAALTETGDPHPPESGRPVPRAPEDRRQNAAGALEIAVVTTGTQIYALVVGQFHDTEEIVVKPLGGHLKGLVEYAGATILGDGTVALILDVAGLAAKADLGSVSGTARAREQFEAAQMQKLVDTQALLLYHNAPDELCAMPLDTVLRIERIGPEQVEVLGGRRTMQYRGGSLPLVTLADVAQVQSMGETRDLAVMISRVRGREFGLLGAMPVDVIETQAVIDQVTHRQRGVAGSTIIRGRTALLTDLYELVDTVWPEFAAPAAPAAAAEQETSSPVLQERGSAVLLAEDSDFFRVQIRRFLEEGGYEVLAGEDGEAAWDLLLENLDRIRAVITDIEMPRLNGMELARRIRSDARTDELPIIALSSLAGEDDVARGKAAGIDEYLVKLDRDCLLERLQELWESRRPETVST